MNQLKHNFRQMERMNTEYNKKIDEEILKLENRGKLYIIAMIITVFTISVVFAGWLLGY